MRILILNQYVPPDPAPTAVLFGDIAEALRARGHEVEFIDAGQEYRGGQGKGGRMRRELAGLWRMLRRGLFARRPDVVISGTSPPCLLVVAQLFAARHRARSIHWCMDLYPEIAVALGEIRDGALSRIIGRVMAWAYRSASDVVALDADMSSRLKKHVVAPQIIRPWISAAVAPTDRQPSSPWAWLYSGNLGRAHEWETLLAAQAQLEARGVDATLVFQGGGPSWPAAQKRAEALGLRRVEWRDYVDASQLQASLLGAACLVVTERPEVQGMLWPSKLALMLTLPRSLLFVGPVDGAIADALRPHPHAASFAPGDVEAVAAWVTELRVTPNSVNPAEVVDGQQHRSESILQWVALVESKQ